MDSSSLSPSRISPVRSLMPTTPRILSSSSGDTPRTFSRLVPKFRSTSSTLHSTIPTPMQSIHISTLRKILDSPEPIDIRLWMRNGEIQHWRRCISLRYDFYKSTRRMKLLDSNEIWQLRDVCIFEVNGLPVFM